MAQYPIDHYYEQHACHGKQPHASRRAATQLDKRQQSQGWPAMSVYQCRSCGYWHLGSKFRKRGKKQYGQPRIKK